MANLRERSAEDSSDSSDSPVQFYVVVVVVVGRHKSKSGWHFAYAECGFMAAAAAAMTLAGVPSELSHMSLLNGVFSREMSSVSEMTKGVFWGGFAKG